MVYTYVYHVHVYKGSLQQLHVCKVEFVHDSKKNLYIATCTCIKLSASESPYTFVFPSRLKKLEFLHYYFFLERKKVGGGKKTWGRVNIFLLDLRNSKVKLGVTIFFSNSDLYQA